MYFSKKYWNIIFYLYKLNSINLNFIYKLNKETNSYLPFIFNNIGFIILYNGKLNNTYKLKSTNFLIKKIL